MFVRFFPTLLLVACLLTGCAVNPLTPTPLAPVTVAPTEVRPKAADATQPVERTPRVAVETVASGLRSEPQEPTATNLVGVIEVVTVTPVVVVEQQVVQATQPPAAVSTEGPPPPTAVPPVWVAPPVSADVAAAEQYCIDLINAQRANNGLPPLARDETVMGIARARVADMVARGYTGHNDPVTGVSLGAAMLSNAGFGLTGENWYGSRNGPVAIVETAMNWFMTDPPHYRSILSTGFTRVGVGIAYNGQQWLLIQNFAGN